MLSFRKLMAYGPMGATPKNEQSGGEGAEASYWLECYTQLWETEELVLRTVRDVLNVLTRETREEFQEVDIPLLERNLATCRDRREYWRRRAGTGQVPTDG